MPITITVPTNPQSPGNSGHTTDHNTIVTALSTLGSDALNAAGDTSTGAQTMNKGVLLPANGSPTTPGSTTGLITANANGTPQMVLPSGSAGAMSQIQTDNTSRTVNSGTVAAISGTYTIPAGDANAKTAYRLKVYGNGTTSSSGTGYLHLYVFLNTVTPSAGNYVIVNTENLGATVVMDFAVELLMMVTTTGSGGTVTFITSGEVSKDNNGTTVAATDVTGMNLMGILTGQAFSTVASNTLALAAAWATPVGSVTGLCSTFERLGP